MVFAHLQRLSRQQPGLQREGSADAARLNVGARPDTALRLFCNVNILQLPIAGRRRQIENLVPTGTLSFGLVRRAT
jgi:hypothetical protein